MRDQPADLLPPRRRVRATWPQLVLAATILLPLLGLGAIAWVGWRDAWAVAARELQREAEAAAEYALRLVEGQRLAGDLANDLLRGLSDQAIRDHEGELHTALKAIRPRLPLVESVYVTDRDGRLLVTASRYPVPTDTVIHDKDWVAALGRPDPPPLHIGRVYRGRIENRLFYAITRPRTGSGNPAPVQGHDGAIHVTVDPNALAAGFMALNSEPGDITALVRSDGAILVRTPGFPDPLPPIPAGSPLRPAAARGEVRGSFMGQTLGLDPDRRVEARLIAFRRVESELPLYVTVARPSPLIVARWRDTLQRQALVGLPVTLALVGLAWLALRRTRAAEQAEAARVLAEARRAAEARFRAVFESQAIGMAVFDVASGTVLLINDELLKMTGQSRAEFESGRWDWRRVTPPEYLPRDEHAIAEARRRGFWDPYEKDYLRPDGTRVPVRISSAPLPGEPGRVVVLVRDISAQRAAEQRRDVLMREVNHRARNALAVVQATLRLMPKDDVEVYARAVEGRVRALARAHTLLADRQWTGTTLRALLASELAAFIPAPGEDPGIPAMVTLEGPDLELSPAATQALAMAIHELATNATKYGALSVPEGHVALHWRLDPAGRLLCLTWEESGGPAVAGTPGRRGFGSQVIETVLGGGLGGRAEREWRPGGLVCRIELPLEAALAEAA